MNVPMKDQLEVLTVCYAQPELSVSDVVKRFPDLPILVVAETYQLAQAN